MSTEATVYVVDDDDSVRRSLRWLLESVGLNVVTYERAESFLDACRPECRGCLLLDVRMPGMSGLDLQSVLAEREVSLPVIIVTGHADVPMAIRAMKTGAFDFVEKPYSDQLLLDRVRDAIEEDASRRAGHARRRSVERRLAGLTSREREVMDAVVDGESNRGMAERLGLSVKTVESHRARVMTKMEAGSLSELVEMVVIWRSTAGKP